MHLIALLNDLSVTRMKAALSSLLWEARYKCPLFIR